MNPIIVQLMNLAAGVLLGAGLFIGGAFFGRKNPRFMTALERAWHKVAAFFKRGDSSGK